MSSSRLSRRDWFKTAGAMTAAGGAMSGLARAASSAASPEGSESIAIGDQLQLFLDGRYLADSRNVRIAVCTPVKTHEKCLEGGLRGYGTILPADTGFRGFHALSKDGSHWRRVESGTPPEPDDLLGYRNGMAVPFLDPSAPEAERFKLANPKAGTIHASSDGADWTRIANDIMPPEARYPRGMDSQNVVFYDPRFEAYAAYVRVNKGYPCPPEHEEYFAQLSKRNYGEPGYYLLRAIGRSISKDLSRFPMPEVVFEPDEKDPHFDGVGVMDFYMPNVIPYERAQEAYFLFTPRYLHYEDWFMSDDLSKYPRSGADTLNTGPEDIGFAASRDGISWNRYERRPWIELGMESSFDSKNMYPVRGLFVHGDEIWMYYTGYDTLHGDVNFKERMHPVMSRVVLRKDGFTCIEADYEGGEFTTPSVQFSGKTMHINVNTSALGLMRVELQDARGNPIEGFALDECDRIHTANTTDRTVTWRGGAPDVSKLAGEPVRLRFELQFGVKVYAFWFK